MSRRGWTLALALSGLIVALFVFRLDRYADLDHLRSGQAIVAEYYASQPALTRSVFFLAYVVLATLSLPGGAVLTLLAGAVFGLGWATLLVSFASSIGATLAFLSSRFLLHDFVQRKFGRRLRLVNAGFEREGGFYLFTLRLIPALPFFVVNLLMGLTPVRTWTYYWVSQLAMLGGTVVFANAGTQLASIDSLASVLSPQVVASFILLGLFPLLAKHAVHRVLKSYREDTALPCKRDSN
jgi:uncharacterized membrane protein YdjX (TVP38/TMEM64 family)